MWYPEKIVMNNLFAHKHSEYEFKNGQCTVIYGRNKSDRGMDNNGAGKTTLFEGIALAYTGQSLRDINKEVFINREEEECSIFFSLKNDVLKKHLAIERKFFRGSKASKVKLIENGEHNKQITSVNEANKRIRDLVGVSREDLIHYFIIPQDTRYSFFSATDIEKKEIINRITSADRVQPVLDKITEELKRNNAIYNDLTLEISNLTGKIEILEEQEKELCSQSNKNDKLKELREELRELIDSKKKLIEKKEETETSLNKFKKSLPKYEGAKAEFDESQKELKRLRRKIEEDEEFLSNIRRQRTKEIVCPECGAVFFPGTKAVELSPEELKTAQAELEKELEKDNDKLKDLKECQKELLERKYQYDEAVEKIEEKESALKVLERRVKGIQETINTVKDEIEEVNAQSSNKEIKIVKDKLKSLRAELKEKDLKLKETVKNIDDYKFWSYNMGKNGFMTYLANQSIKIIEGTANSFISRFNTDLTVLINGFKILADGSIRDKIDVFIQNRGLEPENFMGYSGGERGRIIIAGILAINKLINMSTNGKGLNLLCLDEALPGIDALGLKEIIKVLEKIGMTIMVITQNVGKEANFSNVLYVEKKNNIAKYVRYDDQCAEG